MEPMLSTLPAGLRNEPRDLQSRLYREIGISAVAAALQVLDAPLAAQPNTRDAWQRPIRHAA